jgi:multiple sugar transport system permease protein
MSSVIVPPSSENVFDDDDRSSFGRQVSTFPWLLIAPTVLLLVALTIFPLIYSLFLSMHTYTNSVDREFTWFHNYWDLISDGDFRRKIWFTLQITIFAVAIELVLGLLCAMVLIKRLPGMGVLRLIIYIPMMISPLVVAYFWRIMLDGSYGVFTYFADSLGFDKPQWTVDLTLAKASIITTDVWQWTPFVTLLMLAGLQSVPHQLYEAASLDRASKWMIFRQITLPHLRTPVLLALLFRTIDTFKLFDSVYVITQGGPGDLTETLSLHAYNVGFEQGLIGQGAAISWIVVIVINILAVILIKALTRQDRRSAEGLEDEEDDAPIVATPRGVSA